MVLPGNLGSMHLDRSVERDLIDLYFFKAENPNLTE